MLLPPPSPMKARSVGIHRPPAVIAHRQQRSIIWEGDAAIAYGDLCAEEKSPEDIAAQFSLALSTVLPAQWRGDRRSPCAPRSRAVLHAAIARSLDVADDAREGATGAQTAALSGSALRDRLASATVLARFEPAQELALVEAPQTDGQLVAVAGDGVNDAPASKAAHIGVAMGKNGADLSDGENARRFTNMDAVS